MKVPYFTHISLGLIFKLWHMETVTATGPHGYLFCLPIMFIATWNHHSLTYWVKLLKYFQLYFLYLEHLGIYY